MWYERLVSMNRMKWSNLKKDNNCTVNDYILTNHKHSSRQCYGEERALAIVKFDQGWSMSWGLFANPKSKRGCAAGIMRHSMSMLDFSEVAIKTVFWVDYICRVVQVIVAITNPVNPRRILARPFGTPILMSFTMPSLVLLESETIVNLDFYTVQI